MGFRTDIRPPASLAAFSTTSSTSVGLTIAGSAGTSIYLTSLIATYTGAAQTVSQLVKIFDGSTEIFRTSGLTGANLVFYSPLVIGPGTNLVATVSVSVNTIAGNLSLTYFKE